MSFKSETFRSTKALVDHLGNADWPEPYQTLLPESDPFLVRALPAINRANLSKFGPLRGLASPRVRGKFTTDRCGTRRRKSIDIAILGACTSKGSDSSQPISEAELDSFCYFTELVETFLDENRKLDGFTIAESPEGELIQDEALKTARAYLGIIRVTVV